MFLVQFLIPLLVTMVAYSMISYHLWGAGLVGVATQQQHRRRLASRRRTIKMLVLVVILFAVSWLPLNVYHLVSDWSRSFRKLYCLQISFNSTRLLDSRNLYFQGNFWVIAFICYFLYQERKNYQVAIYWTICYYAAYILHCRKWDKPPLVKRKRNSTNRFTLCEHHRKFFLLSVIFSQCQMWLAIPLYISGWTR